MTFLKPLCPAIALLMTAACATTPPQDVDDGQPGIPAELPEEIVAQLDPRQDLTTIRLMPEDGCFWYRWQGPVETTYLPLRTIEGRMICTQQPEGPNIGITDTEAAQLSDEMPSSAG